MIHPPPPSALCYEILNRKEAEFYVEYAEWDLTLRTMENMRNCTASKKLWQWPHNKQILLLSLPSMFNLLSQMSPSPSSKSESKVQFQLYLTWWSPSVSSRHVSLLSSDDELEWPAPPATTAPLEPRSQWSGEYHLINTITSITGITAPSRHCKLWSKSWVTSPNNTYW